MTSFSALVIVANVYWVCLLHARHYAKCFRWILSLNPHHRPGELVFMPIYQGENWDTKRLRNLPKITLLISSNLDSESILFIILKAKKYSQPKYFICAFPSIMLHRHLMWLKYVKVETGKSKIILVSDTISCISRNLLCLIVPKKMVFLENYIDAAYHLYDILLYLISSIYITYKSYSSDV